MKMISRLMRSVRDGIIISGHGPRTYYSAIARKNSDVGPSYNESRRDYEQIRRGSDHLSLF